MQSGKLADGRMALIVKEVRANRPSRRADHRGANRRPAIAVDDEAVDFEERRNPRECREHA